MMSNANLFLNKDQREDVEIEVACKGGVPSNLEWAWSRSHAMSMEGELEKLTPKERNENRKKEEARRKSAAKREKDKRSNVKKARKVSAKHSMEPKKTSRDFR